MLCVAVLLKHESSLWVYHCCAHEPVPLLPSFMFLEPLCLLEGLGGTPGGADKCQLELNLERGCCLLSLSLLCFAESQWQPPSSGCFPLWTFTPPHSEVSISSCWCANQINSILLFGRGGVLVLNRMHQTFLVCFLSFGGDSTLSHIQLLRKMDVHTSKTVVTLNAQERMGSSEAWVLDPIGLQGSEEHSSVRLELESKEQPAIPHGEPARAVHWSFFLAPLQNSRSGSPNLVYLSIQPTFSSCMGLI